MTAAAALAAAKSIVTRTAAFTSACRKGMMQTSGGRREVIVLGSLGFIGAFAVSQITYLSNQSRPTDCPACRAPP